MFLMQQNVLVLARKHVFNATKCFLYFLVGRGNLIGGDILKEGTFCRRGRSVRGPFVEGTFCQRGHFVGRDLFSIGRFVGGDVLSRGRFVKGCFVEGTYREGTFCMCLVCIIHPDAK